jgi:hypothetical protein
MIAVSYKTANSEVIFYENVIAITTLSDRVVVTTAAKEFILPLLDGRIFQSECLYYFKLKVGN